MNENWANSSMKWMRWPHQRPVSLTRLLCVMKKTMPTLWAARRMVSRIKYCGQKGKETRHLMETVPQPPPPPPPPLSFSLLCSTNSHKRLECLTTASDWLPAYWKVWKCVEMHYTNLVILTKVRWFLQDRPTCLVSSLEPIVSSPKRSSLNRLWERW